MKKTFILFILILLLISPISAFSAGNNRVENGDFEDFKNISGDWETFIYDETKPGTTLEFVNEDENAYARLGCTSPNYVSISQPVFLSAATSYEIGAKIKAESVSSSGIGAYIRLEENQGESKQIKGSTDDWQNVSFYITTLGTDVYTTIEIGIGDMDALSSGTILVDDIYIRPRAVVPDEAGMTVINPDPGQETVQQPETEVTVVDPLFNDNEKLAIICLLFCAAVFMVLLTWYTSKNRPVVSKNNLSPPIPAIVLTGGILLIVVFKYVVASFGTDLSSDLGYFSYWSQELVNTGFKDFYETIRVNYPTGYMYVLYLIGLIGKGLGIASGEMLYVLLIKTPVIIAEVLTALMIYWISRRHIGNRNGLILSLIVLLNPAMLMNTSSWGQIDAVFTLAIILTVYLMQEDRPMLAAIAYGGAMLIKTQAILFLPVVGAYYLSLFLRDRDVKANLKDFFLSILIVIGMFILISAPFMGEQGIFWPVKFFFSSAYTFDYSSMNAFNFYTLFGGNYARFSDSFMLLTYQAWGYIFITLFSLSTLFLVFKNHNKYGLFLTAAFILGAVFTFGHGMHERYIIPLPVLLFFAYIYLKDRRILNAAMLYTVFALLSQAAVLFFFGESFYSVIVVFMSLFGVGCFGYLVYLVYVFLIKSGTVIAPLEKSRPEEMKRRNKEHTRKVISSIYLKLADNLVKKEKTVRLDKTDRIMKIAMTLVYAIAAFINLGSFKIPDTFWEPEEQGEQLIVEFEQESTVDQIKYYFGLGQSDITVKGSEDGAFFYDVGLPGAESDTFIINHQQGMMFRWQFIDTGFNSRFVQMTFDQADVEVRQISFIDQAGNVIPVKSAFTGTGEAVTTATDNAALTPDAVGYMENMYFDEIYHARTAYEMINHDNLYEITHPPLGKVLMSIGIRIFGMNSFGWRFMGTLIGILMLPVMYLFAKRLTKRTTFAVIATFLLMFDFMHFAQTRMATIDSYAVFFIMLMFLFMYRYVTMNYNRNKLYRTFLPLLLCGIAFGMGAATKWLCLYAGAGLAVIFFYTMFKRYFEYRGAKLMLKQGGGEYRAYYQRTVETYPYKTAMTLLFCIIAFILIPALIYYLSYLPYTKIETRPYDFKMILDNQTYMWNYHSHLDTSADPHPFASRWSTWLLDIRPIYLFRGTGYPDDILSSLSSFGNPFVWWALFPAIIIILIAKYNDYSYNGALGFVTAAGLSELLPWVFITRETYIYHYFATVPFLILIIALACKYIWDKTKHGKYFILLYMLVVAAAFFMFYPVITGVPTARGYVEGLRWLESWPFY